MRVALEVLRRPASPSSALESTDANVEPRNVRYAEMAADLEDVVHNVANLVEGAVKGYTRAGARQNTLAQAARDIIFTCASIDDLRDSLLRHRATAIGLASRRRLTS